MNNRIKKLISLAMAGTMVLSLAACSNSDSNTGDTTNTDTNNTTDNNTTTGDTIKVGALFNITVARPLWMSRVTVRSSCILTN